MTPEDLAAVGLRYDVDGAVATVTLSRPEVRNAQTPAMWRALATIGDEITDDVRVVVVRGEGRSFSGGLDRRLLDPARADERADGADGGDDGADARADRADGRADDRADGRADGRADDGADDGTDDRADDAESVAALLRRGDEEVSEAIERFQQGFTWLRDPRFVSIAVVQGHAIGAGFQLALSCDLRVLGDDAQLCMKEPALGLVPDLTGTKPLVDAVGYARALEMCATARTVGAAEALAIGLATLVCPVAELDAALADLVGALTAPMAGAVRETKALLQAAVGGSLEEQRRLEREAQIRRFHELAALVAQG